MRFRTLRRARWTAGCGSSGFSVLEALLVLAVIGVIAAVGVPSLLNQLQRLRLESAANDVANLIRQTRLRAIRDRAQYTVGVVGGTKVAGEGVIDSVELDFVDSNAQVYTGADCQSKYVAVDGNSGAWGGFTITYDSDGTATDTGAICVYDGGENILQILLPFEAGQPKIRKFLKTADAPGVGGEGFYERTSAATAGATWTWY